MPKRSSIPKAATTPELGSRDPYEGKNPAAVELGRLGGKKGGPARAVKLTAERRSAIARHAALTRWGAGGER
jgi:hypothetical protein